MLFVSNWNMRGEQVNLQDIVLNELPEHVDLHCDEVLQEEEEEEQQVYDARDAYEVSICCGSCHRPIKFVCLATINVLRSFESLLFRSLDFLCVRCVNHHRLNHGG